MSGLSGAACMDRDPALFDPETPYASDAVAICMGCPVRVDCRARAVELKLDGVLGGLMFRNGRGIRVDRPNTEPDTGCGTRNAAERHRRNGEPLDDACDQARRLYYRERQQHRRHTSRAVRERGAA